MSPLHLAFTALLDTSQPRRAKTKQTFPLKRPKTCGKILKPRFPPPPRPRGGRSSEGEKRGRTRLCSSGRIYFCILFLDATAKYFSQNVFRLPPGGPCGAVFLFEAVDTGSEFLRFFWHEPFNSTEWEPREMILLVLIFPGRALGRIKILYFLTVRRSPSNRSNFLFLLRSCWCNNGIAIIATA